MSRKRKRPLSEEERRLWERVATATTPLRRRAEPGPIESLPDTLERQEGEAGAGRPDMRGSGEPIPPFRIGERAEPRATATAPAGEGRAAPLSLDRRSLRRLRQGRAAPEARIDLHGMTLEEAHGALTRFILSAQARGLRLVLVITGKGEGREELPFPYRRGVLRRQVPVWLRTAPLSLVVAEVGEAYRRHGGEGAFYVRLRRRSAGPVS